MPRMTKKLSKFAPVKQQVEEKKTVYCICGRAPVKDGYDSCELCIENEKAPEMKGWVYRLLSESKLKKYWMHLVGLELFTYKSPESTDAKSVHIMKNVYVKEEKA